MNAAVVTFIALVFLAMGYRYYSKFISRKVFRADLPDELMPSHKFRDNIDYIPTPKYILFGHHFSSIAGAAPILGPAIAVIWGWLPALLWIVFGSIFIGAVHDYGALIVSVNHKGKSIGLVTKSIIGKQSGNLFLIVIFLLVFIIIAVFAYVIANLFVLYPGTVIPINFQIIVAITIGLLIKKNKNKLLILSIISLLLLYVFVIIGFHFPVHLPTYLLINNSEILTWIVLLMVYGFIASVLPVWVLLQPRDLINSHQLIVGLVLIYLGIFVAQPLMDAPMVNFDSSSISWFPFLFITIACGAISGFHSLVSSGTTAKQLDKVGDARAIGYGSMLMEAILALAATIAVAAGFDSQEAWYHHYNDFQMASGMQGQLKAFVDGTAGFLSEIGITQSITDVNGNQQSLAAVFVSVMVISFAATTLDTAIRIQRYIVGEIGDSLKIKSLRNNRYLQTTIAVLLSLMLILTDETGKGGLKLWALFGTTNQLLGSLALLVISVWLFKKKLNYWYTLLPMILVTGFTLIANYYNFLTYLKTQDWLLVIVSFAVAVCQFWIILAGIKAFVKPKNA